MLAAVATRVHRLADRAAGVRFRDWWLLCWLALVTHPLLDAFTVYGTQLLLPFSDYPVGLGSVFIIDPLYTVPLATGLVGALLLQRRDPARAARWNRAGLVAATVYLAWSLAAQSHVTGHVVRSLAATPLAEGRTLVTPTPFNTLLWRVVVMDGGAYHEGHVSVFDDGARPMRLVRHENRTELLDGLRDDWTVRRLAWFAKGFYGVQAIGTAHAAADVRPTTGGVGTATAGERPRDEAGSPVLMTDLRMGQTPWFVFSFVVAERRAGRSVAVTPVQVPTRRPPPSALQWLWRRIWDPSVPAPLAAAN